MAETIPETTRQESSRRGLAMEGGEEKVGRIRWLLVVRYGLVKSGGQAGLGREVAYSP